MARTITVAATASSAADSRSPVRVKSQFRVSIYLPFLFPSGLFRGLPMCLQKSCQA